MPTKQQCVELAEAIWKHVEEEEEEKEASGRNNFRVEFPGTPESPVVARKPPSPFRKRFIVGRSHTAAFVVSKQLVNMTIGSFKETDPIDDRGGEGIRPGVSDAEINHYQSASDLIHYFLHERTMCASSTRAITATFALVERLIREMIYTRSLSKKIHYVFQDDQDFYKLMNFWKNAALAEEPVLIAVEMLKKLQWFISVVPDHELLRFDKRILLMFMQVMVKQSTPRQAPQVIESLMEFAQSAMEETNTTYLAPDVAIYELLLKAWAKSGSPHASQKLEEVLVDMGVRDISMNINCYAILIRYWAGQGNLLRAKALLDLMQSKGLEADLKCYGHLLHGFTRLPQPSASLGYLEKMYQISSGSADDVALITAAVLQVLHAFHRRVLEDEDVNRNVIRAENVLRKFESDIVVANGSDGTFHYD
jgi:pentatricopeptide repeat protein